MNGNGQKRPQKGRYQPPPSKFKTCLMDVPVPKGLEEGVGITKILTNGKPKEAFITLSKDKFTIYVTANKFKPGKIGNLSMITRPLLQRVRSLGSSDDEFSDMSINIGSVERISEGQNTLRFELARNSKKTRISSEDRANEELRSFSIIFSGEKTIDIILPRDCSTSRNDIVTALNNLLDLYNASKVRVGNDVLLLRHIWNDVDKDQNDSINCAEFREILNRINVRKKKAEVEKMYNSFGKMIGLGRNERRIGLSFEQCVTILHKTKRDSGFKAKPVREIFFELFGSLMNNGKERTRVSADSFKRKFMWQKQGEPNTADEDVEIIFRRLNRLEYADIATNLHVNETTEGKYIDKDRFEAYLVSEENDIFDPKARKFDKRKMTKSLSQYWINSSHNTYLTGDQLQSRSSVEMYLNALHRGCRCIEIDCFNGYRDSDGKLVPMVFHGKTITTKILFSDIIKGINLFLNNTPDCYPLILSLENHCSISFQDAMADILESILGDKLYLPDEKSLYDPLPSPEELKGRVLIKGKRLMDSEAQASDDTDSDDDSEIGDEHRTAVEAGGSPQRLRQQPQQPSTTSNNPDVSIKLSNMTIFCGVRLTSFDKHVKQSKDKMLSFNEAKGRKLCRNQVSREEWVKYNQSHLSRVYPSGSRVDSSNFCPITGWSTGCQLIALNLQTNDVHRRLNDGRFQENGNCGYVLKPNLINDVTSTRSIKLSIKILTGTCLPKPNESKRGECIDPYVQVCLYDIPLQGGKETATIHSTRHESNNGFNPIFSSIHADLSHFKFRVQNPDVAMLQFSVYDRDVGGDDFIASASVPVSCIREGYRSVQLYDANHKRNGAYECASLLVEVTKSQQQDVKMW